MTKENESYFEAIAKIIKLTQEEKIKWQTATKKPKILEGIEKIDSAYTGEYLGKTLRIYKVYTKSEKPYLPDIHTSFSLLVRPTEYQWTYSIVLEIIDKDGNVMWTFPNLNILSDLYEEIGYKIAGVSDFICELLKEK